MKFKLTLVLALALTSSAQAATYYASPSGNDGNSCAQAQSTATPKRTIGNVKNCLSAGDTLRLRGGTYNEYVDWTNTPTGNSSNSIVVENYPGETAIWATPRDRAVDLQNVSYITFRGLIFDGSSGQNWLDCPPPEPVNGSCYTRLPVTYATRLVILGCYPDCATHLTFESNEFRNTSYGSMTTHPGANDNLFRNNYFHHNGKVQNANHIYTGGSRNIFEYNRFEDIAGAAIAFYPEATATGNIVRYNMMLRVGWLWAPTSENGTFPRESTTRGTQNTANPWGNAIFFGNGTNHQAYGNLIIQSPSAIYVDAVNGGVIYNNTVVNSTANNITPAMTVSPGNSGIFLSSSARNTVVKNNISYQPGVTIAQPLLNQGTSNTVSDNLCDRSSPGCSVVGDPRFVSPANLNFSLQTGSPAIKAGAPEGPMCSGTCDIGAMAWSSATVRPTRPINLTVSR